MEDIFSEALEKAHTREGILGSISESKQDFLEKGKRAQVGEIREWRGQKFQKQPNGGWLPVKGEKKAKKEDGRSSEETALIDALKKHEVTVEHLDNLPGGTKIVCYDGLSGEELHFVKEEDGTDYWTVDTDPDNRYEAEEVVESLNDSDSELDEVIVPKEKSEKKKDTHGVEKKVLDFLAVSSNKYNDISKVSIYKTPKGNWALQYDGKDVSVVGGNTLSEADLKAAGLLEEEEEEETKKEEIEMPSEKDFFRATGLKYNHPVEDYQVSLAILNEVPDDHKMWTGKTAGEMKELLTKQITKLGGSTDVGTMKDWFVDE